MNSTLINKRLSGLRSAFTLVELLVVIAIISLLMSMVLPGITSAQKRARIAACSGNLRGIGTAIALFADSNDDRIPEAIFGGNQPWVPLTIWSSARANDNGFVSLGLLVHRQYLGDWRTLYCPAQRSGPHSRGDYGNWPNGGSTAGRAFSSYDVFRYFSSAAGGWHYPDWSDYGRRPLVNDTITTSNADFSLAHEDEWNVLYADGSVRMHDKERNMTSDPSPLRGTDMRTAILLGLNHSWPNAGYLRNRLFQ